MLELNSETFGEYAAQQLAEIQTGEGVIMVHWIPRRKEILCSYGGRYYRGQNEEIGATLATVLNQARDTLVPSDLKIFDTLGKFQQATDKALRDLLTCEWSDYACDKLAFQCHVSA
jgi:hypothetical protein